MAFDYPPSPLKQTGTQAFQVVSKLACNSTEYFTISLRRQTASHTPDCPPTCLEREPSLLA